MDSQPRSLRGVSGDDPEGGARRGVLRRRLVTVRLGRLGTPPLQALRPGCEELAARIRKAPARRCRTAGAQGDGSAAPGAQNRHGGAPRGERPASWDARRLASAWPAASCAGLTGAAAPERFSALRPPLDSGWRSNDAKPGRRNAPREREDLGCLKSE